MLFTVLGFACVWAPAVWTWLDPSSLQGGAPQLDSAASSAVADLSRRLKELAPAFYTTAAPDSEMAEATPMYDEYGVRYTTTYRSLPTSETSWYTTAQPRRTTYWTSASAQTTAQPGRHTSTSPATARPGRYTTTDRSLSTAETSWYTTAQPRHTSYWTSASAQTTVQPGRFTTISPTTVQPGRYTTTDSIAPASPTAAQPGRYTTTYSVPPSSQTWYSTAQPGRYATTYVNGFPSQTWYTTAQPGSYVSSGPAYYAWTTRAINTMWSSTWTWGGRADRAAHGQYNGYAYTTTRPWSRNRMTTVPMSWWVGSMTTTTAMPTLDDHSDHEEDDMKQLQQFLAVAAVLLPIIGVFFAICLYMISSVIHLVSAIIYFQRVTSQRDTYGPPESSNQQQAEPAVHLRKHFRAPFCSCMDDMSYCLHGCFCMIPRQADSAAAAGVWEYWHLVLVAITLHIVGPIAGLILPFGDLLTWAAMAYIFGSLRAKLRAKVGGDPSMTLGDFCTWCCFPCCAAIQEAKEIDIATRTRVEVCCFLIKDADGSVPLVGNAVEARTVPLVVPASVATGAAPVAEEA